MADVPQAEMGKTFTAKVRILEAVCGIDFPNADEQNFRVAIMKSIGADLKLSEVRALSIAGNSKGVQRPGRAS